jgi:hypothetical protein
VRSENAALIVLVSGRDRRRLAPFSAFSSAFSVLRSAAIKIAWPGWLLVLGGCGVRLAAIPPRPADALAGSAFVEQVRDLPFEQRERRIFEEITGGNLPGFLRRFEPVAVWAVDPAGARHEGVLYVSPDYLSVGSDADFVRMPMSPLVAQPIADRFGCLLPTRRIVDAVFRQAAVRLEPAPFDPRSLVMTSVDAFVRSHRRIEEQLAEYARRHPPAARTGRPGGLVAGIKKDVVISPQLAARPGKVAIYGWHRPNGEAIQPLYLGHAITWVDYSHGVRLVSGRMKLDGRWVSADRVLSDPVLSSLLSDEGPLASPRYAVP